MKSMTNDERSAIGRLLTEQCEKKLNDLNAEDPGWRQRVEDRKNKLALGRLRVEKDVVERNKLISQIRLLTEKLEAVDLRISQKMPAEERSGSYGSCPRPMDMCKAVGEICKEIHDSVMKNNVTGRKALALHADLTRRKLQLAKCETREDLVTHKVLD